MNRTATTVDDVERSEWISDGGERFPWLDQGSVSCCGRATVQ